MKNTAFDFNLTPQREHLLKSICRDIKKRTLRTESLQIAMIHMREVGVSRFLTEWGHSIAHSRRNRGWLWIQALQIWATHLYYESLDRKNVRLSPLPMDVFLTIKEVIEGRSKPQLDGEMRRIYGNAVPREEIIATLEHMYVQGGSGAFSEESDAFMFLRSKANDQDDENLIRWLVQMCEDDALSIPPISMEEIVADFENSLKKMGLAADFDDKERQFLELHFLVSFHNTLLHVNDRRFFESAGFRLPENRQIMLTASAYDEYLGLHLGFYTLENGRWLEPDNIRTGHRFERYFYPVVRSNLREEDFLIEPDDNIRACLYNHPLNVRMFEGGPVLVALERHRCRFPPVPFRLKRTVRRRLGL